MMAGMESESMTTTPISIFEEIFPGDTNAYGTAFGGKVLALIDRAAGLAASRFAKCHFVTASLDALEFREAVRQGEIAEVAAEVVYTSKHTCAVKTRVFAIDKTRWDRRQCCEGILFMVAIGPDNSVQPIPQLVPNTEADQEAWDEAHAIHMRFTKRKKSASKIPKQKQ